MVNITIKHCALLSIFTVLIHFSAFSQSDSLRERIARIVSQKDAVTCFALYDFRDKVEISYNMNKHCPMQSVFKFHIALAVLNEVDKGHLSLDQKIDIDRSELLPGTWSPMREDHPEGNIALPLRKILSYTVSQSDNNGCDILLHLIGGPAAVQHFMDSLGVKDFSIRANEAAMHKDWNVQFTNWTTPVAAADVLRMFYEKSILSEESTAFLWKIMTETTTGMNRIRGQLPPATVVAHKTGSSGRNDAGLTAAANDIGIVMMPDGNCFAICVFVTNSTENETVNDKIISDVAKAAWDYFTTKP